MFAGCVAAVIIIIAIIFMSLRVGRKNAAVEILPFLFVPLMFVIGGYLSDIPLAWFCIDKPKLDFVIYLCAVLVGAVFSCVLAFCFVSRFERKRSKILYVSMLSSFDVIFSAILIIFIYRGIFPA